MTTLNPSNQAAQFASSVSCEFQSAFRDHLTQQLDEFFNGGCAEIFAEVVTEKMTPLLAEIQQAAALPISPASPSRRPSSPTRGLGFGKKLSSPGQPTTVEVIASDP